MTGDDFKTAFLNDFKPGYDMNIPFTDKDAKKLEAYFQKRKILLPQDYIDFVKNYNHFYYRQGDNTKYCPASVRMYGYSRGLKEIVKIYKIQRKYEKDIEKIKGNGMPPDRYLLIGNLHFILDERLYDYDLVYNLYTECYEIIRSDKLFSGDTELSEEETLNRKFQETVLKIPSGLLDNKVASFSGIYELVYAVCCGDLFKVPQDDNLIRKINNKNKLLEKIKSQKTPACVTQQEIKKFMRYARRKLYIPMLPKEYLCFLTEIANGFMQHDIETGDEFSVFSIPTKRLERENKLYYDLNSLAKQCEYDDGVISIGRATLRNDSCEIKCDISCERYFVTCRSGDKTKDISFNDFYEAFCFTFEAFNNIRKD